MVSKLRFPRGLLIGKVKYFFKMHQVEKLDQRQKPAKWAQLLGTGLISGQCIDLSGLGAILMKPFTIALFPAILFPLFYQE